MKGVVGGRLCRETEERERVGEGKRERGEGGGMGWMKGAHH